MTQKRQILLQNALSLLYEAQRQATNLKEETQEELKEMMSKLTLQLLQSWHENKNQLPEKLTHEMDRLLDKIGLIRKTKVEKKKAEAAATKKTTPKKKVTVKAVDKKPSKKS